jgi:uncharacterized protein
LRLPIEDKAPKDWLQVGLLPSCAQSSGYLLTKWYA